MKKLTLILIVCVLLLTLVVPGVAAQDDELPVCSEEELAAVVEAIDVYSEGIASLEEISDDPGDAAFGAVLVGYDLFSYEFWNTVFPEFPECVEAQALGFAFGLAYDEVAIAVSYANIAGWADAFDEAEAAEYFAEASVARLEEIVTAMEAMEDASAADLVEELPACSMEEYEANEAALEEYLYGLDEVINEIGEASDDDLETMVAILVAIDILADLYWDEIYGELPGCAEAEIDALVAGLVVDELVLITSLAVNAMLELEAENTDTAEALIASAEVRYEDLIEVLDEMGMMDE